MDNLTGKIFGRYLIKEQIGHGGMGSVYKALDTTLDRIVAVKIMSDQTNNSPQSVSRFRREAKAMAQLSHPAITKILDYGDQDGILYLVMEFMPGGTLKQQLGKPLIPSQAASILLPIAKALAYSHQHGIIHRDIKPSNILFTDSNEAMLSDFGIAKSIQTEETTSTNLTGTGVGIGTPDYMAPEQGLGREIDQRADLYSLGVVFYEMITGVKPYTADTPLTIILKHASEPLPSPKQYVPTISDEIERFVYKFLAKKPEDRFTDMGEIVHCLEKISVGKKLGAVEAPPLPKPASKGIQWKAWLPAGLVILSLLAVSLVLLVFFQKGPFAKKESGIAYVMNVSGDVSGQSGTGSSVQLKRGMTFDTTGLVGIQSGEGQARLGLSDGSTICIGQWSDFEIVPEVNDSENRFNVNLKNGKLILASEDQDITFIIQTPYPLIILGKNIIFGLEYNPNQNPQLDLSCLSGGCVIQNTSGQFEFESGTRSSIGASGVLQLEGSTRYDEWATICADLTKSLIVSSVTPSAPTPSMVEKFTVSPAISSPTHTQMPTIRETPTVTPSLLLTTTSTLAVIRITSTPMPKVPTKAPAAAPPTSVVAPPTTTVAPPTATTAPTAVPPTVTTAPTAVPPTATTAPTAVPPTAVPPTVTKAPTREPTPTP